MIFIDEVCPICKIYKLGSQSTSNRHKSTFKTCGSKECSSIMRCKKHKSGAKFTRNIKEYLGNELCECGNRARYQFKSGKICCQSIGSNCPIKRKEINNTIAQKLKTTIHDDGLTLTQKKANKSALTKRADIDEFGKNGYDRFSQKLRATIEASRDKYGRSYLSRAVQTLEEFLQKPEKERYYEKVWFLTEQNYTNHFSEISCAHLRSTEYHLDHIFSISEGFKQNIPAEVIAHYTKLRVIPAPLNCSKQGECHKTLTQLYEDAALARTSSKEISFSNVPFLNTGFNAHV